MTEMIFDDTTIILKQFVQSLVDVFVGHVTAWSGAVCDCQN
jgi:hypothetical protein